MEEVVYLSASELAARLREGEFSARQVVDAHIARIEAINPKINAMVIPMFDQARARADEADARRASGEPVGPLHRVPVTIKEQYRVTGPQTTLGATNKIGNVYRDEGSLVTALRDAGAIVLGKTNIIQTLAGWESDNRVYGRSNNPWNLERSPGGSSGGEAAIVAAGGSALGLAGDYGGSTRVPAHFCGVHGLKPTSGRLTNDDFPIDLLGYGQETFIPQPGPIARTVADLCRAMQVFTATSMRTTSDVVPPVPWRDPRSVPIEGMRVGFYTDNCLFSASPAIRRAVEEAAQALRQLGASVEQFSPPDSAEGARIFLGAVSAGGGDDYRRLLGNEKPIEQVAGMLQGLSTPPFIMAVVQRIMQARGQKHLASTMSYMGALSTKDYWKIVEARTDYRARFHQLLDEGALDAVICPPAALPAFTHGSSAHLLPALSYAFVYNVIGAPAGVVAATRVRPGEESDRKVSKDLADTTARKVEEASAGLPVGVQVVSRYWREDAVLAVMEALENHFRQQPDYPARPALGVSPTCPRTRPKDAQTRPPGPGSTLGNPIV